MKYVYLTIIILLISACSQQSDLKYESEFKQIQIHFFPAFMTRSMITLDMNDSTILFKRIGQKEYLNFKNFPDTIIKTIAPSSFLVQLNDSTYEYINTIPFIDDDLSDRRIDANDGIFTNILFVKKNNEIIDIDLSNATTENHEKLILKILETSLYQAPDSATKDYLTRLEQYYR